MGFEVALICAQVLVKSCPDDVIFNKLICVNVNFLICKMGMINT